MDISIVIPCYNHGHFIQDAIDSVETLTGVEYEIIIVDDGSDDAFTIQKLEELKKQNYKIISHTNRGLAYTRNIGIRNASGRFILPLDADNKIKPDYIYKALDVFNSVDIDIVYAEPIFFGEQNPARFFTARTFNINELLESNYIDACAIFKRDVWKNIGGYDEKMPEQGHEDWEFWINAFTKGYKFYFLNEKLYYYRVLRNSMIDITIATGYGKLNHEYIVKKHVSVFLDAYRRMTIDSKIYSRDKTMPFRSSLKYFYKFLNSAFSNQKQ